MQTKEKKAACAREWYRKKKQDPKWVSKQKKRRKTPKVKMQLAAASKKYHKKLRGQWFKFIHADKLRCSVCGYNKCFAALDFHHTDSVVKDFEISQFVSKTFNKQNQKLMLKELGKCICMCKNCHTEFHDLQRKLKNDAERQKEDNK